MVDVRRYENPADAKFVVFSFAVGIFWFVLALPLGMLSKSVVAQAFMYGVGLLTIAIVFAREYVKRPREVQVGASGISMVFLRGRTVWVGWREIEWVDAVKGEILGNDGMLKKNGRLPYPITYEIAVDIRAQHATACGDHPPTRDQFRKRVRS